MGQLTDMVSEDVFKRVCDICKKIMDGFDKYTKVAGLEDKDGFKRRKDFPTCFGSYIVGWTMFSYIQLSCGTKVK